MNRHTHASASSGPDPVVTVSVAPATEYASTHTHGINAHTHRFNHWHNVTVSMTIPGINVNVPAHTHSVEIPSHTHTLTLEAHEHGIVYGIYKGPRAAAFTVEVDGAVVPASAFDGNGVGDIAPYLGADSDGRILRGTFHTLRIRPVSDGSNPNGLCRIRASWSAQVFISSLTGKQY